MAWLGLLEENIHLSVPKAGPAQPLQALEEPLEALIPGGGGGDRCSSACVPTASRGALGLGPVWRGEACRRRASPRERHLRGLAAVTGAAAGCT